MPLLEGTFRLLRKHNHEETRTFRLPEKYITEGQSSGDIIGMGQQGVVIAATDNVTKENVALKQIRIKLPPLPPGASEENKRRHEREQQRCAQCTTREWSLLEMVYHPHIVNYLGAFHVDPFLYLIMEKMDFTLAHVIETGHFTSKLQHTAFFLYQILQALDYLDKNNIMHRDIKPANVGVNLHSTGTGAKEFTMKLLDLGLSRLVGREVSRHTMCVGSTIYEAPEINFQRRGGYSTKVDIWSLFVTAVELLTGTMNSETGEHNGLFIPLAEHRARPNPRPYVGQKMLLVCGIPTAEQPYREAGYEINWRLSVTERRPISEWINGPICGEEGECNASNFFDLLEKVFVFDPELRPSAAECLDHEFFKGLDKIFHRKYHAPIFAPVDYHAQLMKQIAILE